MEDVPVKREVGDHGLQLPTLLLQLPDPPELAHAKMGVLLLPRVERHLVNPELPAAVAVGRTAKPTALPPVSNGLTFPGLCQ